MVVYYRITKGLEVERASMVIEIPQHYYIDKERTWIKIKTSYSKTAVCFTYFGCSYSDQRHAQWNHDLYGYIQLEVFQLQREGFRVVIAADFNGHIGAVKGYGIPGNKPDMNANGKMLLEFSEQCSLKILNRDNRIDGDESTRIATGLWTRQRGGVSSVIDYVLISAADIGSVVSMEIDETGEWGGGSDHN